MRFGSSVSGVSPARPSRAIAYTMGNSICSGLASRSRKSSYTSSTTSLVRASGRSTLLTTSTTGSFASSALRRTKRVCGSGPSEASTRSSTPSTIVSPRSTSPPKSAWPGVSTMLIFTSPRWTAVFLARIVIPFSRSRSIESSTRSFTSWFSRNEPDCQSIASTSVVFPWSTCATIATLRRSLRLASLAARVTAARVAAACPLSRLRRCLLARALLEPHQRRQDHVRADERCAFEHQRLAVAGDLPHRERGHDERADEDRVEDEGEVRLEQEREQDERREEEDRDLRDGVLHHRHGEVRLPLGRQRDPDDILDRVPGDRHDHEPGERLRDPERLDRGIEGVDEPLRNERGRDAARREHGDRDLERQGGARVAAVRLLARLVRAEVAEKPDAVHREHHAGADDGDGDLVRARTV